VIYPSSKDVRIPQSVRWQSERRTHVAGTQQVSSPLAAVELVCVITGNYLKLKGNSFIRKTRMHDGQCFVRYFLDGSLDTESGARVFVSI